MSEEKRKKKPWYIAIVLVVVGAIAAIATLIQNAEVVCSAIDTRVGTNLCFKPPEKSAELAVTAFTNESGPAPGNVDLLRAEYKSHLMPDTKKEEFAFRGGARLETTLSVKPGSGAINVSSISVAAEFIPGQVQDLHFSQGEIKGFGIAQKLSYRIYAMPSDLKVLRVVDSKPIQVEPGKILGDEQIKLTTNDPTEAIAFEIHAPNEDGLIRLTFTFIWTAGGSDAPMPTELTAVIYNEKK